MKKNKIIKVICVLTIVVSSCLIMLAGCGKNSIYDELNTKLPKEIQVIESVELKMQDEDVTGTTQYQYEDSIELYDGIMVVNGTASAPDGTSSTVEWIYTVGGKLIARREYGASGTASSAFGQYSDYVYCLDRTLDSLCNKETFRKIEPVNDSKENNKYKLEFTDGSWMICEVSNDIVVSYTRYASNGIWSEMVDSNSSNMDTSVKLNFDEDEESEMELTYSIGVKTFAVNEK